MRYKRSALKSQIINALDPKIIDNAKSVSSVVESFESKILKEPVTFRVGKYEVTVEAKGERSNPDLHLSCSCDYWVYQGPEYHAKTEDYLLGPPRGSAEKPTKRDPDNTHKICKHVYAVLRDHF